MGQNSGDSDWLSHQDSNQELNPAMIIVVCDRGAVNIVALAANETDSITIENWCRIRLDTRAAQQ
jgi:hypothetical protein